MHPVGTEGVDRDDALVARSVEQPAVAVDGAVGDGKFAQVGKFLDRGRRRIRVPLPHGHDAFDERADTDLDPVRVDAFGGGDHLDGDGNARGIELSCGLHQQRNRHRHGDGRGPIGQRGPALRLRNEAVIDEFRMRDRGQHEALVALGRGHGCGRRRRRARERLLDRILRRGQRLQVRVERRKQRIGVIVTVYTATRAELQRRQVEVDQRYRQRERHRLARAGARRGLGQIEGGQVDGGAFHVKCRAGTPQLFHPRMVR